MKTFVLKSFPQSSTILKQIYPFVQMRPLKRPKIDNKQQMLPFLPVKHMHTVIQEENNFASKQELKEWRLCVHEKYSDWIEEPCLPLERMNPHPRDEALIFIDTIEHPHMYLFYPDLEPNPYSLSVTSLKKKVIPDQNFRLVAEKHVLKDDFLNGMSEWSSYLTPHGVLLAWELNREQAAQQGTMFHRRVEGRLNESFATLDTDFKLLKEIQETCQESSMQAIQDKFDDLRGQAIFLLERNRLPVYQNGMIFEKVGPEIIPVVETWWEDECTFEELAENKVLEEKKTETSKVEELVENKVLEEKKTETSEEQKTFTTWSEQQNEDESKNEKKCGNEESSKDPADQERMEQETQKAQKVNCLTEMVELSYFDEFWKTFFKKHYPNYDAHLYRTEMRIWDREALVPGTIDCVVVLIPHPGCVPKECEGKTILLLLDWKRSKKLDMQCKLKYGEPKFFHPPFHMLEVCNGSEFTFQLNAYKYIMEKLYLIHGKPVYVLDMYACVFNRCLGKFHFEKLRDVSQCMHKFMVKRIQELKTKKCT